MTKIVNVRNIKCGGDKLFMIAGPCVIEDESIMMKTAEELKRISEKLKIEVIFKSSFQKDNRSSLKHYEGPGMEKGLKVLQKIKDQFGFPLITDIHHPEQAASVADVVDVLQIPAYLCMQTSLVVAAAKTGSVINIKHGQFLAPENMKHPVEKCLSHNNDNILLTERGYTFGYNDLIVDPRSFFHLRNIGYPVIFDITHSVRKYGIPSSVVEGAAREFLPILSRAGVAAGVDGIFMEVHPNPTKALCDGCSQLNVFELEEFLKPLLELHKIEVASRK